jgi:hypothetical protein
MTRHAPAVAPLALAAALAGCNTNFTPQYLVQDLRVLAIRAEVVGDTSSTPAADAAPGQTLRVSALVANPAGRAPLIARWLTCPPTGTDALPPCLDPNVLRDPDKLATTQGVFVLAEGEGLLAFEEKVPDSSSGAPPEVATALANAFAALEAQAASQPSLQCQLYVELPLVLDVRAGDRRELAVKRVRLVPSSTPPAGAYLPNRNPALDSVVLDPTDTNGCVGGQPAAIACGSPGACGTLDCDAAGVCGVPFPPGQHTLCGIPGPGSIGTFDQCAPDGTRTPFHETLDWQWYATAGTFPDAGTLGNATGTSLQFSRPARPFTLWAIVRDGRGGEAWIQRDVP